MAPGREIAPERGPRCPLKREGQEQVCCRAEIHSDVCFRFHPRRPLRYANAFSKVHCCVLSAAGGGSSSKTRASLGPEKALCFWIQGNVSPAETFFSTARPWRWDQCILTAVRRQESDSNGVDWERLRAPGDPVSREKR